MLSILALFVLLFLFIFNPNLVLEGATTGLKLWYENVLPLLLPFMLISNLICERLSKTSKNLSQASSNIKASMFCILLGFSCGFPIGGKTCATFLSNGNIKKSTANLIFPLCNNASPIFITGFLLHKILQNQISMPMTFLVLYAPQIFILLIRALWQLPKKRTSTIHPENSVQQSKDNPSSPITRQTDLICQSLIAITTVGIILMLCCIAVAFLMNFSNYSNTILPTKICSLIAYACPIIEMTQGLVQISMLTIVTTKKTALLLSLTAFGGISSILQTKAVTKDTELSIISYIICKVVGAIGTYYLYLLLI